MERILTIDDLYVSFDTYAGEVKAVRGVSLHVDKGEVLAIVGESGCGKSVTAQTIMRLNPEPPARICHGKIELCGQDIVTASEKKMQSIRGKDVSMIFQDPMSSLNPTMAIGAQLVESICLHQKRSKKQAEQHAIQLLKTVQIPNPEQRIKQYPHEFSGGMRQRVMIAMALSCNPHLLIADEPTTALDVTIQAQIMDLLADIRKNLNSGIILITHDLGVVAGIADRVAVMYAGKVVETGTVAEIFYESKHPYTTALLGSQPQPDSDKSKRLISIPGTPPDLIKPPEGCPFMSRCRFAMNICKKHMPPLYEIQSQSQTHTHTAACWLLHKDCTLDQQQIAEKTAQKAIEKNVAIQENKPKNLISVKGLSKYFRVSEGILKAVDHITLDIRQGETFGLVGESGCGKSTLGRVMMGIYQPTSGELYMDGVKVNIHDGASRFQYAKKAQMIFQDPYASLNPRMTVGTIISEGMVIHNMYTPEKRKQRVEALLETVGLNAEHANRFPHEFSGGQRQRIGIARALAIEPQFIVCDEPISALDVSIQSQIINLLQELQAQFHLTYMFISHDLNIVKYICDRVGVMYLGNLVELAPSELLYQNTLHPYSKALLSAVPVPDPAREQEKHRIIMSGDVPSPIHLKPGCNFASRCPQASERCRKEKPLLREVQPGHFVACHDV